MFAALRLPHVGSAARGRPRARLTNAYPPAEYRTSGSGKANNGTRKREARRQQPSIQTLLASAAIPASSHCYMRLRSTGVFEFWHR